MVWPFTSLLSSAVEPCEGRADPPAPSGTTSASKDGGASPMQLLQHFASPGVPLPPSARVGDPRLKQRQGQPLSIWQLGKLGAVAAKKDIRYLVLPYDHEDTCADDLHEWNRACGTRLSLWSRRDRLWDIVRTTTNGVALGPE